MTDADTYAVERAIRTLERHGANCGCATHPLAVANRPAAKRGTRTL